MTEIATKSILGERLRVARKEAKFTIARLARELGVDPRTVAGWQSGRSAPSLDRLIKIARLLKKPPSYFVNDEEQAA
ncbi:MAG: helix-turn-helix domain-containing protein [Gemmatimonadaceae bacterium]|nr:helix-turn-helix domain-containing protein [Gemmatimonadaceae bacterium]